MKVNYFKKQLQFKRPSGTSRGVLNEKETWIIKIEKEGRVGYGECGLLRGLSYDDRPDYEATLKEVCNSLAKGTPVSDEWIKNYPSIRMGVEMALNSLAATNPMVLYPSPFTEDHQGIPINGLVWMGSISFMEEQISTKIEAGFDCIKIKIGALDFENEYQLLKALRNRFSAQDLTIRVDANGAFKKEEALPVLERLAKLDIHSIEQPIAAGQIEALQELCHHTPLPIALDEELIGIHDTTAQEQLLTTLCPQYIVLKPSLLGGFAASSNWIALAKANGIGWWVTSALESNIGLNAIAQWTATLNTEIPQGLGTGMLYKNNFESPLRIKNGYLHYEGASPWNINL